MENIFFENAGCSIGKLLIHGIWAILGVSGVSNAGGTPEEPAFSSTPSCERWSSENRHNNPRRLFFSLAAFKVSPSPFGKSRNSRQLFQGPSVPTGGRGFGGAHLLIVLMPTVQPSGFAGLSASHRQRGAEHSRLPFLDHELEERCVAEKGGCKLWEE